MVKEYIPSTGNLPLEKLAQEHVWSVIIMAWHQLSEGSSSSMVFPGMLFET